jgi:hypothetical protein
VREGAICSPAPPISCWRFFDEKDFCEPIGARGDGGLFGCGVAEHGAGHERRTLGARVCT